MPIEQKQGYCPHCQRSVLATRNGCNHLIHAIVTIFLCGFWIPIWMIAWLQVGPFLCPECGSKVELTNL